MDGTPDDAPERMSPEGAPRLTSLGDLLAEFEEYASRIHEARETGTPTGPMTGFDKVDTELGGSFAPGIHIIHGGAGAGKTAFAMQVACQCDCPALVISCEMSPLELLRRITARVTGEYLDKLKSGELSPARAVALVKRACATAPHLRIADAIDNPASRDWIEQQARALKGRSARGHVLIVVDSIHSWAEAVYASLAEYEALNLGLSDLRTIANRLDCPILGIAERNRASRNTGGVAAGAGSRKLEYKAETVLDLSRKEDEQPDADGWTKVEMVFNKNRNGAKGKSIPLRFNGAMQKFEARSW